MFRFLFTIALAIFLVLFIVRVEPNAEQDPVGASMKAMHELRTFCDREEALCGAASAFWNGTLRVGQIGFSLATGTGSLVYVQSGDRASDALSKQAKISPGAGPIARNEYLGNFIAPGLSHGHLANCVER